METLTDNMKDEYDVESFAQESSGKRVTVDMYRRTLGRVERWIGKPLGAASVRDILRLKDKLRGMPSGKWHAAVLRMFYNRAYDATDDPRYVKIARSLKLRYKVAKLHETDILSLPEVNRLIAGSASLRDRALLVMLWETGGRIHEVLALDVRDVQEFDSPENGGRMFYKLTFRKVKVSGEEHAGYITEGADHLRAWLNAHPNPVPESPVFPGYKGGRIKPHTAEQYVRKLGKRTLPGKRVYPHLFRHSRATHLLRMRVPEAMVKKLLGWTPGSPMLSRYSHLANADAYMALLRAQGYKVPDEPLDFGKLIAFEGDLRPVNPMPRSPEAESDMERVKRELADMKALLAQMAGNPAGFEAVKASALGK